MKSALEAANEAWDAAPMHIKMMAGAYVAPILAALADQDRRITKLAALMLKKECEKNGKS